MSKNSLIRCLIILIILVNACSKSDENSVTPTNEVVNGINKSNMLNLINSYRSTGCNCGTVKMPAVAKLIWNDKLGVSANKHTTDMASNNYFSHTSKDGRTMSDRIKAEGYSGSTLGENIAMGQTSEKQVIESWINSPGHCANIMNGSFTDVGFARSQNYWTQNFGRSK
jgi:uncharacterized protein YkwD